MSSETIFCPNCGLLILPEEGYCMFCDEYESDSTELRAMYEDKYDLAGSRCDDDGKLIPEEPYTEKDEDQVWGERNSAFEFIGDDFDF